MHILNFLQSPDIPTVPALRSRKIMAIVYMEFLLRLFCDTLRNCWLPGINRKCSAGFNV
jgi:hypothetical protein